MNAEIAAAFRDLFRIGEVVSTDPKTCTAKVQFKDTDDFISGNLQVLQNYTTENQSYSMPDIGEDVACLFLGNGSVSGFILGKVYNAVDTPVETGQDITYTKFKDETLFKYDRENHKATADIKGNAEITVEEKMTVTSPEFTLTAETSTTVETGKMTVNSGDVTLGKNTANVTSGVVCELSACPLFGIFHPGSSVTKTAYP